MRAPGLNLGTGETLKANTRHVSRERWPVMIVQRDPGELYLQGGTRSGQRKASYGWVERIDPVTLEPVLESPRLPSGGHNWCGAATVHENGDLYLVNGCYCHRLSPALEVVAERRLPIDNAHNGHLIASDGNLITKDIQNDPTKRTLFTVLDPDLNIVDHFELPENSVGRFSSDRTSGADHLYVTSATKIYRLIYREGKLVLDDSWQGEYDLPEEDQGFAWDSCIGSDSVWFHDMGENGGIRDTLAAHPIGTQVRPLWARVSGGLLGRSGLARRPRLLLRPLHAAPLRVFRFSVHASNERDVLVPFGDPHGWIAAPPLYDQDRRMLVSFDSANGKVGAWRYHGPGRFQELWIHPYRNTNQPTLYTDTGELLVDDVRIGQRWDAVVVDIETGHEKGRVDTGGFMSGAMWYTPGFGRDFYTTSGFGSVSRLYVT